MKQATELQPLRRRLLRLCGRRRRIRWATAFCALVIALLGVLGMLFALDWYFQRNIDLLQRAILVVLGGAAVLWAVVRFVLPWLGTREDLTDVALLVQEKAGIDSDLVAALQFESQEAARWGSVQLESAVIHRVAVVEKELDFSPAVPREPLASRVKLLALALAAWAFAGFLVPEHVGTFFQRLAFGTQHYPARTQLISIKVNGTTVDLAAGSNVAIHVPCGQAVRFEVTAAGVLPGDGRVDIVSRNQGVPAVVRLEHTAAGEDERQAVYQGVYPRLSQSARYQVHVGDAWSDPLSLSVTPLPVVEVAADVVPPAYARKSGDPLQSYSRGTRQIAVLLGSEVRMKLYSDRPLKSAHVILGDAQLAMSRESPVNGGDELWSLPAAGTPLACVAGELPYAIRVQDAEGQVPDKPLEGLIAIEPDVPPSIAVSCPTPVVLPTGAPTIRFEAADDHALSRIWLTWEATSADPSQTGSRREGTVEVTRYSPDAPRPSDVGDFALPLEPLSLAVGDTLRVTFHVADCRGPAEPATTDADRVLTFQVTDLHGFLSSMEEADQKTAGTLENIRKTHTGEGK